MFDTISIREMDEIMAMYQRPVFVLFEGTFVGRISENSSKSQSQQYEETVVVSTSDIYRVDLHNSRVILKTPFSLDVYRVDKFTAAKLVEALYPIDIEKTHDEDE